MRGRDVLATGVALVLALGASAGCQEDIVTAFPPGLEPLEDDKVPPITGGAPLEELVTLRGEDGFKWVHARGVIRAAPGAIWTLAKDPERMGPTCATDRHTITLASEPQYELSFAIHNEVDEVVTVAWDEQWRYGTITGTPAAPARAMIRYQKVFGSDFITTLAGSIQLLARTDAAQTEVELVEHLDAFGGSADDMEASMRRRFTLLVAAAHGQPRPDCP